MHRRATDGARLDELVSRGIAICREAERQWPRKGPGRKPTIPDWVLAVMIMVGVMLKKKTKAAQFVWWTQHATDFARWLPEQAMPGRSTFYERYRRVHRLLRQAIVLQGREAVKRGWADAECVAVDKSLIAGQGRAWNRLTVAKAMCPVRWTRTRLGESRRTMAGSRAIALKWS